MSDGQQDATYRLLRHLTPPVCAVTTSAGGRRNGFIVNSAQRASLVPTQPRISLYISKINFSHDLVMRSGLFGVHLLRADQWDVIRALGLRSAREVEDKLGDLDVRTGTTGCPMLVEAVAGFECRVVNIMDAGGATFFLGDIVDIVQDSGGGDDAVMTSVHFRANAPADLLAEYESRLVVAQGMLERLTDPVRTDVTWTGPQPGD